MPGKQRPLLRSVVLGCYLAALPVAALPAGQACRSLEELIPPTGLEALERIPSDRSHTGSLWRWSLQKGSRLELKLQTPRAGDYEIAIRAVKESGNPVLAGSLWEAPLRRQTSEHFGVGEEALAPIPLDPVALGPGHHPVELLGIEAGTLLLDCVSVRRTGKRTPRSPSPQPASPDQRAFLGVQLDSLRQGGVAIDEVYPGTAAEEFGLQPGDVIVKIGGASTSSFARLQDVIGSHDPGDTVAVELLRAGERVSLQVRLGHRPAEAQLRSAQSEAVLDVLQLRPGMSVADLGCGSGWLSEAIAARLDGNGTVYAVEIQEQHIARLYGRSIPDVVPVLSLPDDVLLPEGSLDLAVLHDVASHIDSSARPAFYESVKRALKPGAHLAVFGPHGEAEEMLRVLRENGLVPLNEGALRSLSAAELDERLEEGILFRLR